MKHGLITPERLALSTDLYELTMAAAYFAGGAAGRTATFDLNIRQLPPERGFLVVAGLEQALAYLRDLRFTPEALAYLARSGHFRSDFLDYLSELRFSGSIDAMPEGTVAFPPAPLLRATAPIIEAQIVETYLLTTLTFQTMIASKAARIVGAADRRQVVDFSPRRDHGPQAGLLAARAAYIGGCVGTSNVLAGERFGLTTYGTMAHSFIMFHASEEEAFAAFARSYPGDPTLLIDTYDTMAGARMAVRAASALAAKGRKLAAVRLDSGDLVVLSRKVRAILDEAGLQDTKIFASGGLDEHEIHRLLAAGAEVDAFGVGTELGTSGDAPSLDSTYKLVAYADAAGEEKPVIKLSTGKTTLPGRKQVWRLGDGSGRFARDTIGLVGERLEGEPLLLPAMRDGQPLGDPPALDALQQRAAKQLAATPEEVRRLRDPVPYPVECSAALAALLDSLRQRGA
ncbi:MAG: nicotinate phosphoribosyltransferase [Acidobacteriota bacterium]